jgi:hypothetical protein
MLCETFPFPAYCILLRKLVALQFLLRQSLFRTLAIFDTHVIKDTTVPGSERELESRLTCVLLADN